MKFPKLYEIARSAGVAVSPDRALTIEQKRSQDLLVDRVRQFGGKTGSGVVLPWHESRTSVLSGREVWTNPNTGFSFAADPHNPDNILDVTKHVQSRAAMSATGTTSVTGDQGGMTIGTDVPDIGTALRDNLVVEKLGARVLGGLRDNINLPRASVSMTAEWLSENATANDTADTFATLNLKPKRVTASMPVSDQLLAQGENFEAFIRADLMAALAVEIQRVVIGGTGSSNQPLGILNTSGIGSVVGGTNGAAPTLAHLSSLEYAVTGTGKADRGNLGWLLSPYVRKKLRQTFINGTGSDCLFPHSSANALLGHAAGVTPGAPDNLTKGTASGVCSSIIFGEFSELFIGLWGPGIIVNAIRDTTLGVKGQTLLIATAYVDCGVRSPAAFAAMNDALAA